MNRQMIETYRSVIQRIETYRSVIQMIMKYRSVILHPLAHSLAFAVVTPSVTHPVFYISDIMEEDLITFEDGV